MLAAGPAAAGCAGNRGWRLDAGPPDGTSVAGLPDIPEAHRTVERVALVLRGREVEMVGYRTWDPDRREVRVQLLLESGLSVLDAEVAGAAGSAGASARPVGTIRSGGVLDGVPRFADTALRDLARLWGPRSAFAASSAAASTAVAPDGSSNPAVPLPDGSWLAVARFGDPWRAILLDRDLVPEARIEYAGFDDDGVPRDARLEDLRDGHRVDVEVQEVLPAARRVPGSAPIPGAAGAAAEESPR